MAVNSSLESQDTKLLFEFEVIFASRGRVINVLYLEISLFVFLLGGARLNKCQFCYVTIRCYGQFLPAETGWGRMWLQVEFGLLAEGTLALRRVTDDY